MHLPLFEYDVHQRLPVGVAALEHGLAGYLTTNQHFCAPVVTEAVATLRIRSGAQVRPGETVALFHSGYCRASFLPGLARLELLVRLAWFRRWRLPADGPHQHGRPPAWLLAGGAVDTTVRVFPRIGFPDEAAGRAHLEGTVRPELRASTDRHGAEVGLTETDLADVAALTTPGDPRHAPDQAGHHIVQPAVLVTGRPS